MSPKYVEKLENSYELWKHKMRTVVKSPGFETRMMWAYILVLLFASLSGELEHTGEPKMPYLLERNNNTYLLEFL